MTLVGWSTRSFGTLGIGLLETARSSDASTRNWLRVPRFRHVDRRDDRVRPGIIMIMISATDSRLVTVTWRQHHMVDSDHAHTHTHRGTQLMI